MISDAKDSLPARTANSCRAARLFRLIYVAPLALAGLALAVLFALLQPATSALAAPAGQTGSPPGIVLTRTVTLSANDVRNVYIYEPTGYTGLAPTSLVLALHGGGGSGRFMLENTPDIWQEAERDSFLVVYPDGQAIHPNQPNRHFWGDHALNTPYINEILDHMLATYPVDADRIYMVGFSGGAQFIYHLAADPATSQRLAGIGTVAGPIGAGPDCPSVEVSDPHIAGGDPLPAFLIQGLRDPRTPIEGGYDDQGVFNLAFDDKVDIWVNHVGGVQQPTPVIPSAPGITAKRLYENAVTNNAVVGVVDPTLRHSWPHDWLLTGDGRGAMGAFWDFFQHYPTTAVEVRALRISSDPPGCVRASYPMTYIFEYVNPDPMQQVFANGMFTLPLQTTLLGAEIVDPGSLSGVTMSVFQNVVGWTAVIPPGGRIQVQASVQVPACNKPDFPRLTATGSVEPLSFGFTNQADTHFVRVECEPFGPGMRPYYLPVIRRE